VDLRGPVNPYHMTHCVHSLNHMVRHSVVSLPATHVPCSRPITSRTHQSRGHESRSPQGPAKIYVGILRHHPEYESPCYMFILLPYALHDNSLYVYVLSLYKYSSLLYVFCQFEYQLSNLLLLNSLSSFLSFFLARLQTLLLCPDLRNSRHPARERHNPQVEANASHDFGPDISVQIPRLTINQAGTGLYCGVLYGKIMEKMWLLILLIFLVHLIVLLTILLKTYLVAIKHGSFSYKYL